MIVDAKEDKPAGGRGAPGGMGGMGGMEGMYWVCPFTLPSPLLSTTTASQLDRLQRSRKIECSFVEELFFYRIESFVYFIFILSFYSKEEKIIFLKIHLYKSYINFNMKKTPSPSSSE